MLTSKVPILSNRELTTESSGVPLFNNKKSNRIKVWLPHGELEGKQNRKYKFGTCLAYSESLTIRFDVHFGISKILFLTEKFSVPNSFLLVFFGFHHLPAVPIVSAVFSRANRESKSRRDTDRPMMIRIVCRKFCATKRLFVRHLEQHLCQCSNFESSNRLFAFYCDVQLFD